MKVGGSIIRGQKSGNNLKQSLRDLILNVPLLSDLYLYYWVFPKSCAEYRGKFASFSAALQAIPHTMAEGYNKAEFYRLHATQTPQEINQFQSIDYPVLVWLREAFADSSTVFDLGGNTGYSYYTYQKYIPYPASLKWKVCELPAAVNAGNEMLERFPSPGLSYTVHTLDAEGFNIFLTCGTLQYLKPSLSEILQQFKTKPRHLIIHHVPFYNGAEYFTLQNLLSSYVPYKIQNRAKFLASLTNLGYELIDSWEIDRTCRIPFHPECFVDAYYGFYLRLKEIESEANNNEKEMIQYSDHSSVAIGLR